MNTNTNTNTNTNYAPGRSRAKDMLELVREARRIAWANRENMRTLRELADGKDPGSDNAGRDILDLLERAEGLLDWTVRNTGRGD